MSTERIYQSVTIWLFGDHFVVRGWHRGASHFLGTRRTLQEAADLAFATPRKELTVGLKPRDAIGELADKIAPMVAHVTGGADGR